MPPVVRILGSGGYPLLDHNPCAAPQIGRVDDPFDSVTTLNPVPVALQYREGSARAPGHWYVMATESGQLLPAAGAYNVIVNGAQALDCQAGQFAPMLFPDGLKQRAAGAHRRPSVCVPAPSWFSVYSKPLPNSSTARCRLSVSKPPCNAYGPPLSMPASACPMAVCRR